MLNHTIDFINELDELVLKISSLNNGWYGDYKNICFKVYSYLWKCCENVIRKKYNQKLLPVRMGEWYCCVDETDKIKIKNLIKKYIINPISNKYNDKKQNKILNKVIYIYEHIDVQSHIGWLKIGESCVDAHNRIKKQNEADNVRCRVLFITEAKTSKNYIFSDKDIHKYLETKGVEREYKYDIYGNVSKAKSEWFKITLKNAMNYIQEYKNMF